MDVERSSSPSNLVESCDSTSLSLLLSSNLSAFMLFFIVVNSTLISSRAFDNLISIVDSILLSKAEI